MQHFCTLKQSCDFKTIYKKGSEIKTRFLVVKYCHKKNTKQNKQTSQYPLLGITISRKIGKAVKRNLIRRRLKAIFDHYCKHHNITNLALSFYTKKAVIYASFQELKKDVDKILKSV